MGRQIYSFRPHSCIKADPQVAGEICAKLESEDRLSPENLLDECRPEDAPMHDYFEWDDAIAAEKYRVNQSAHVIRCLQVTVVEDDKKPEEPKKAYFCVHTNDSGDKHIYRGYEYITKDSTSRGVVLNDALRELNTFRHKYERYRDWFGPSFQTFETFVDQLKLNVDEIAEEGQS